MPLSPDTVFLFPPKVEMTLTGTVLHLRDRPNQGTANHPIDIFFESLAQTPLPHAAVVLSGTGSDGSEGVIQVANAGGIVFTQSPESAEFPGMPESALATESVTQQAPPSQLPGLIITAIRRSPMAEESDLAGQSIGQQSSIDKVLSLLHDKTHIDFQAYKLETIHRRIERRMSLSNNHNMMIISAF